MPNAISNTFTVFNNQEFGNVRAIRIGGELWFVGVEIAGILRYRDTRWALGHRVRPRDKRVIRKSECPKSKIIPNFGLTVINERGVLSLVSSSSHPDAKRFKEWFSSEVIPSVCSYGGSAGSSELFVNTYLPFADDTVKSLFHSTLDALKTEAGKTSSGAPKVYYATRTTSQPYDERTGESARTETTSVCIAMVS